MACVDSKCSVFRFSLLAQMRSDVYKYSTMGAAGDVDQRLFILVCS